MGKLIPIPNAARFAGLLEIFPLEPCFFPTFGDQFLRSEDTRFAEMCKFILYPADAAVEGLDAQDTILHFHQKSVARLQAELFAHR